MKAIYISFFQMLRQMKQDIMLIIITLVPLLAGAILRFIIPIIEDLLTAYFNIDAILTPYYELFDLFLIILTPVMLNYVVAMLILEENDDHMIAYLAVTPLGKTGYLLSRLGIISLVSFPVSIFIALLFRLSNTDVLILVGIALAGTVQGVVVALLIVVLSTNKVEGMAVGKMSSIFTLGILAPYFVAGKEQYFLSVLPSFWMARAVQSSNFLSLLIAILLAIIWTVFLYAKFMKKITG